MSYTYDKQDNSYVIKGFENGIADSPYSGISDMRNVNIISIPGEASVNFSTSKISQPTVASGVMTSMSSGADTITYNSISNIEARMAIIFDTIVDNTKGVTVGPVYWLGSTSTVSSQLYTDYNLTNLVNITGTTTGTFSVVTMTGYPKHFVQDTSNNYWAIDSTGRVWTNSATIGINNYWIFTGNTTLTNANGNGLTSYTASDGTIYIFAFRNSLIDYLKVQSVPSWVYGWKPSDGSTGNTGTQLKTAAGTNNLHEAIVAPDNKVYYTDANWIGRWYQADPAVAFVPTTPTTYVFDETQILPFTDIANCLAPLGNNLLIGGQKNIVYPWDTTSPLPSFPIFVAESNVRKLVTINTNTFIFAGNRGRIYVTNGSQASLYKKIPDHISGTIEPYFTWGGAASNKSQLYFSASATTNANVAVNQYGGVWAIDLDTKAMRLVNKLSYATYAGLATAIIPITPYSLSINPNGTGLYIGWDSGASTYGMDTTSSTPYTSGESTIDSDLIPIGTFLKPTTNGRVEFKLAVPIVNGESIKLQYRQSFSDSFTDISSTTLFTFAGIATKDWTGYSGVYQNVPFENSQWVQVRAVLTSTASSPSYVRLTEIRLGN